MQCKGAGEAPLRPDRALGKPCGQFGAFTLVNFPADDLPAEDVLDEVEAIEQPKRWSRKPGDVPRPDLPRAFASKVAGGFDRAAARARPHLWFCPRCRNTLQKLDSEAI
jgi:hypothetical protein